MSRERIPEPWRNPRHLSTLDHPDARVLAHAHEVSTVSGTNEGQHGDRVTDGGVAGIGRFVAVGAVSDRGKVVVYRTVKGPVITLRTVTIGKKGTITFLIRIDTN